ncbi:MAG TPA: flagellin FliC [Polaromonas sp.]|nr:flagellin FliC [Polaromonas sp.]
MSTIINTNSLSLLTQNNLIKSQSSLTTAIQRLSSGLRINSAKDDAAGQAIANRFTANITGLTQSQRNANDGISLAQTTEGALNEINTNLQRVRELTVQSSNGSNSVADKASIQAEITQRLAEIDRTSAQTDFNGTKVLSSSAKALNIQVGANDGETISIGLKEISSKTLGLVGFNVDGTGTPNAATTLTDLKTAGFTAGAVTNGTTLYTKAYTAADNASLSTVLSKAVSGDTVVDAGKTTIAAYTSTGTDYTFGDTARAASTVASDLKPAAGGSTAATFNIGGTSTNAMIDSNGQLTSAGSGNKLYLDTTGHLTETGGGTLTQANVNGSGAATLGAAATAGDVLASMGGLAGGTAGTTDGTITVGGGASPATYVYVANTATATATNLHISNAALATQVNADNTTGTSAITIKLGITAAAAGGPAAITYDVAAGTAAAAGAITSGGTQVNVDMNGKLVADTTASLYLAGNGTVTDGAANVVYNDSANAGKFSLNATSGATTTANPLAALDAALSTVDKLRGSLGAVQNRFDSVISNLGSTITNLSASRSRIQDADYATEVSNMTRAQILQQAGTSVLAKANQSTQGVMTLLQ